jgi:foldase protein PrsA
VKSVSRAATASLAVCAGAVFALAGCGNQVTSPGAAAIVGGQRISTQSLQQTVNRALRDPQAQEKFASDRAGFTRSELTRLIDNILVDRIAARLHVTATAADIDAEIGRLRQQAAAQGQQLEQAAAAGGVPRQELRTFIRYFVLQQKLSDALVASVPVSQAQLQAAYLQHADQFDQVHAAHILVKDKKTADQILTQVRANPSSFAALAAKDSLDTSNKDSGGDLGFAGRSQFVSAFSKAIFAAKPGSFIEVHTRFGWHVVHVIAHRTVTLAQATPQLRSELLQNQKQQLLGQTLAQESKKLGVHVNPRYGRWDATKQEVLAPNEKNGVSSPSPTASSTG